MSLAALIAELDCWASDGRRATLWLRDDDACEPTPALERLTSIAGAHDVPLALATIPARLDLRLCDTLGRAPHVTVLQHGFAHVNHAPEGFRSAEVGANRPLPAIIDELQRGRHRLREAFASRFLPVLVPPWNRIAPEVVERLAAAGFCGVSTFAPRPSPQAAPGLRCCNAHVDLIGWRRGRVFIGDEAAAARIAHHLGERRTGRCDADEPTGILTHHLVTDDGAWAFLDVLFAATRAHPAAHWLDSETIFCR
jgi:hypothetical protein